MAEATGNGSAANLRPPWKPGESGNPGGRIKRAFADIIRDETKDGLELVRFHLGIFRCQKVKVAKPAMGARHGQVTITRYPSLGERRQSAKWLTEYMAGKPRVMLEIEGRGVQPIFIVKPEDVAGALPAGNGAGNGHGAG